MLSHAGSNTSFYVSPMLFVAVVSDTDTYIGHTWVGCWQLFQLDTVEQIPSTSWVKVLTCILPSSDLSQYSLCEPKFTVVSPENVIEMISDIKV